MPWQKTLATSSVWTNPATINLNAVHDTCVSGTPGF
jgi:hypothetical protein